MQIAFFSFYDFPMHEPTLQGIMGDKSVETLGSKSLFSAS